jgi:hypothetical protein
MLKSLGLTCTPPRLAIEIDGEFLAGLIHFGHGALTASFSALVNTIWVNSSCYGFHLAWLSSNS